MSKRRQSGSLFDSSGLKKSKLYDDNDEDIWGEDFEPGDVEECIELATQMTQTYSQFLKKTDTNKEAFSSTQNNKRFEANNSNWNSKSNLKNEKLQLIEQNMTKDGEIAILRNKLKHLQQELNQERLEKMKSHEKKQNEWLSKLNEVTKARDGLRSELDFKVLEVMNLKHKIAELEQTKTSANPQQLSFSRSKSSSFVDNKSKPFKNRISNGIQVDLTNSPLKDLQNCFEKMSFNDYKINFEIPVSIFNHIDDKSAQKVLKTQSTRSNCHRTANVCVLQRCKSLILDRQDNRLMQYSVNSFSNDLIILLQCDQENHIDQNVKSVQTIFKVSVNILLEFEDLLTKFVNSFAVRSSDGDNRVSFSMNHFRDHELVQLPDLFSNRCYGKEEFGIEARRCMVVLGQLLQHSSILKTMLNEKIAKYFENHSSRNDTFIEIISNVVIKIEKMKRSYQFSGFLSSVLVFLKNAINVIDNEYYKMISRIIKHILLSKPDLIVIYYLIDFLHRYSVNEHVMESLCENSAVKFIDNDSKNSLIHFNSDSCTMQILVTFMEAIMMNSITAKIDDDIKKNMIRNILELFYNISNQNFSWKTRPNKKCKCLLKMNKLTMCIIYEVVNGTYFKVTKHLLNVCLLLFHEMNLIRCGDVIDKDLKLNGQYCNIINKFKEMADFMELSALQKYYLNEWTLKNESRPIFVKDEPNCVELWNEKFENFLIFET